MKALALAMAMVVSGIIGGLVVTTVQSQRAASSVPRSGYQPRPYYAPSYQPLPSYPNSQSNPGDFFEKHQRQQQQLEMESRLQRLEGERLIERLTNPR